VARCVDDHERCKDLGGESRDKVARAIDKAHRLAIDLGGEDFGRQREERAPCHVPEESHAAQRDREQNLIRLLQRAEQNHERREPDEAHEVLDQASIIEITRMRTALEVLALRYAIPNLTQDDITCAENAMHKGNTARDISTWEAANREFHAGIYRPCQMPRLLSHIDALHEARLRYMYATSTLIEWDVKSENEHLQSLEAIRAKDGRSACALMEKHIDDAGCILVDAVGSLHTQTDE